MHAYIHNFCRTDINSSFSLSLLYLLDGVISIYKMSACVFSTYFSTDYLYLKNIKINSCFQMWQFSVGFSNFDVIVFFVPLL